jgi:hypothetical protein
MYGPILSHETVPLNLKLSSGMLSYNSNIQRGLVVLTVNVSIIAKGRSWGKQRGPLLPFKYSVAATQPPPNPDRGSGEFCETCTVHSALCTAETQFI